MSGTNPDPNSDVDYYDLLDVSQDATDDEITTAYRKKIKEYHPDLSDASNAQEMTQLVNEAKAVLTDPAKRAQYDRRRGTQNEEQTTSRSRSTDDPGRERSDRTRQRQTHTNRTHTRSSNRRHRTDHSRDRGRETQNHRRSRTRTRERSDAHEGEEQTRGEASQSRVEWVFALFWRLFYRIDQRLGQQAKRLAPSLAMFKLPHLRAVIDDPVRWILAPTPIRLAIAAILATPVLVLGGGLSPQQELLVVVTALVVSYGGYEHVGPFSFEYREPHSKPSFNPGQTVPVYPMVVVNLAGYCILISGFAAGAPAGGLAWIFIAVSTIVLLSLAVGAVFAVCGSVIGGFLNARWMGRGAIAGAKLTPIGLFVVAFTKWGGELRLSEPVSEIGPGGETVWVSQFVVGPLEVGTLLTFLIGLTMIGCLIVSVLYMIRFFTRIPSWDRYEHGYRIRPGVWNLLVTGPLALIGWFAISDVSVVWLSLGARRIPIDPVTILIVLFFLPTPLATVYSLRRRVEPWITAQF